MSRDDDGVPHPFAAPRTRPREPSASPPRLHRAGVGALAFGTAGVFVAAPVVAWSHHMLALPLDPGPWLLGAALSALSAGALLWPWANTSSRTPAPPDDGHGPGPTGSTAEAPHLPPRAAFVRGALIGLVAHGPHGVVLLALRYTSVPGQLVWLPIPLHGRIVSDIAWHIGGSLLVMGWLSVAVGGLVGWLLATSARGHSPEGSAPPHFSRPSTP